jgi:hypothetical protein
MSLCRLGNTHRIACCAPRPPDADNSQAPRRGPSWGSQRRGRVPASPADIGPSVRNANRPRRDGLLVPPRRPGRCFRSSSPRSPSVAIGANKQPLAARMRRQLDARHAAIGNAVMTDGKRSAPARFQPSTAWPTASCLSRSAMIGTAYGALIGIRISRELGSTRIAMGQTKYVQTVADGRKTDNLL